MAKSKQKNENDPEGASTDTPEEGTTEREAPEPVKKAEVEGMLPGDLTESREIGKDVKAPSAEEAKTQEPESHRGTGASTNQLHEDDDLREVNRKIDNQAEVERFRQQHAEQKTPTGNTLRNIAQVTESVLKGEHGSFTTGPSGPRVTR